MSTLKVDGIEPQTGTTVTTTGNVTVTGVISGSSYVGDGSSLSGIGIAIQENDGSPAVTGVQTIKVTNATLTDNGLSLIHI